LRSAAESPAAPYGFGMVKPFAYNLIHRMLINIMPQKWVGSRVICQLALAIKCTTIRRMAIAMLANKQRSAPVVDEFRNCAAFYPL